MITSVNAANAYATARRAVAPSEGGPDLGAAVDGFAKVMAQADQVSTGAMTGATATHDLVTQISETKLALEAVVSIRDKVVEAYQEILRMPV
ncbi:flagellar hook-basal body complex protein FliE (plasmid) [Paracoccus sp. TK19116]|uniref:Flagellar hook-basal body complex protein FliE n=1 Tax=Paracoccus albicereus TaxID=2922394 RepID=A0ABT1MNE9_9RHOB|nr:flagellar hook-basal body complex protein FliE [Paracoccus albicereus]MCQ0969111.1 flagellar hook-basal body complex protein FliE [Paracoccus albicereus]